MAIWWGKAANQVVMMMRDGALAGGAELCSGGLWRRMPFPKHWKAERGFEASFADILKLREKY